MSKNQTKNKYCSNATSAMTMVIFLRISQNFSPLRGWIQEGCKPEKSKKKQRQTQQKKQQPPEDGEIPPLEIAKTRRTQPIP